MPETTYNFKGLLRKIFDMIFIMEQKLGIKETHKLISQTYNANIVKNNSKLSNIINLICSELDVTLNEIKKTNNRNNQIIPYAIGLIFDISHFKMDIPLSDISFLLNRTKENLYYYKNKYSDNLSDNISLEKHVKKIKEKIINQLKSNS